MPRLVFWPQAARVASTAARTRSPTPSPGAAMRVRRHRRWRGSPPRSCRGRRRRHGRCRASAPQARPGRRRGTGRRWRSARARSHRVPGSASPRAPQGGAPSCSAMSTLADALQPLPGRHAVDLEDLQPASRSAIRSTPAWSAPTAAAAATASSASGPPPAPARLAALADVGDPGGAATAHGGDGAPADHEHAEVAPARRPAPTKRWR